MRVCVFCSSSDRLDEVFMIAGRAFGTELGRRRHELIYGGYGRGLMGEVARGAYQGGARITAVIPAIFNDNNFIYEGCTRVISTADLRERKKIMQLEADAFAVLPGGVGTYDELFDTLALTTLGELNKPVGVLDVDGFYRPLRLLLDEGAARGFIAAQTADHVSFYTSAAELLDALERVDERRGS